MKKAIVKAINKANQIGDYALNHLGHPILVLMYHRVIEDCYEEHQYAVTSDNFRDQIAYIKDNFQLLRFEDDWSDLSRPGCVVTFDDGYYDNYLIARDFLEPAEVPATFFITTQNLDTDRLFWWDRLLLNQQFYMEATQLSFAEIALSLKNSHPEKIRAFFLKYPLPYQEDDGVKAGFRSMTSDELRELSQLECSTIGAHTVNHPRMTVLDEQDAFDELSTSKQIIEQITGMDISVCSFPFGAHDRQALKVCKALGFKKAATTVSRNAYTWQNPLTIPRINVENDGADAFRRTIQKHLAGIR